MQIKFSDPASRAGYEQNYTAFAADLQHLDAWIRDQLREVGTHSFMVFHPSWGYFADAYGMTQIPIESAGRAPGPRTMSALIDRGRKEGIKVIFVQRQFSRRAADTLAQAIGAKVVVVDPLAENYMDNLRRVTQSFAEAMKQ